MSIAVHEDNDLALGEGQTGGERRCLPKISLQAHDVEHGLVTVKAPQYRERAILAAIVNRDDLKG